MSELKDEIKSAISGLTSSAKVDLIYLLIQELNYDDRLSESELIKLLNDLRFEVL